MRIFHPNDNTSVNYKKYQKILQIFNNELDTESFYLIYLISNKLYLSFFATTIMYFGCKKTPTWPTWAS